MRNAYALLGLAFLIVFGAAYVLLDRAEAPSGQDQPLSDSQNQSMSLSLTSPEFANNAFIPEQYTCDGENVNPPLSIKNIPEGTESLVLVMDDPDIPKEIKESRGIDSFDHWVVYNIPPETNSIAVNEQIGTAGQNSSGQLGYAGPCPPPQYEPKEHRYIFRLYALSGQLNFIKSPSLFEVEEAAKSMMLEKAELVGRYSRAE